MAVYACRIAAFLVATFIGGNAGAVAQTYPSRAVRFITDVGTGGTYDIFARALAEELHKRWGQAAVVEPRPGGNSIIGARACADAAPDGYTLCILSSQSLVNNEFMYKTLPYSLASFRPIMNLFYNTQVIIVSAALNVKSLPELAALAKAKPKTLAYIVPGVFQHIFFDRFNKQYGVDLIGVPFKGGGDVLTGVLSGVTPIAFIGGANFVPYVRDGKMVALAVDANERSPLFPDAPTLTELGYRDNMPRTWLGLMAPAGTPDDLVAKASRDVAAIMSDANFRQHQIIERGLEPIVDTPEQFAAFIVKDRTATGELAKEAGITPQ